MTTTFDMVAPRVTGDVARLYVEARVAGLEVSHYSKKKCRTFDGLPEPGAELGVFRLVASLIFYKDDRRWEVRVRSDANAVELATAISCGLNVAARKGRTPGHFTRLREFRHKVSARTNKPIAHAGICYRLDADDLLGVAATSLQAPMSLDDELRSLTGIGQ